MHSIIDDSVKELQLHFANLGADGGQISPSIYDTAQLLRLYPQQTDRTATVEWLLTQQQADGGWGDANVPLSRTVPTFASLIALHAYRQDCRVKCALVGAQEFLQTEQTRWAVLNVDELPIATEMILPYLIGVADEQGLSVDRAAYEAIYRIQQQKLKLIEGKKFRPGSPPTYSWEAFSGDAQQILPDCSGGIGHSPAATAAWLNQMEKYAVFAEEVRGARHYLTQAAEATGLGIPGVVPNVWPITGFELSYAPYILLVTSLLKLPGFQDLLPPMLDKLGTIFQRGDGVSFGEYFTPDVDDTGLALGVLQAHNCPANREAILKFRHGAHFATFHQELNPSVLANAHALYGLANTDERFLSTEEFLCSQQQNDGRWLADKLHSSWLYTTLEVIIALNQLGYQEELQRAMQGVVSHQKADGSWGGDDVGSRLETSYALLALALLRSRDLLNADGNRALTRGHQWLRQALATSTRTEERLWIGKELYSPYRVDKIYELSALLSTQPERMFA